MKKIITSFILALGILVFIPISYAASPNIITSPRTVVKGDVTFSTPNARTLNANQASNVAIVDHAGTSLNSNQRFNITQPNANALYVARDTSGQQTVFAGRLNANGRVIILNRNGTLFTSTARINVGGLVASTGTINDDAVFNNPNQVEFSNFGPGIVENQGRITIKNSGLAALVGPTVRNSGVIQAKFGRIELAGVGTRATVDFAGDGLLEFAVGQSTVDLEVTNTGRLVNAEQIALRTQDAVSIVDNVINTDGVVTAKSFSKQDGKIVLSGGKNSLANVENNFSSDGTAEISATTLRVFQNHKSTAKHGTTYTSNAVQINNGNGSNSIAAGDTSFISAQSLESSLNGNRDVKVVSTEGDVTLKSKVQWTKGSTIEIASANDINLTPTPADQAALIGTKGRIKLVADNDLNMNSQPSKWTRLQARYIDIETGRNVTLNGDNEAAWILGTRDINVTAQRGDVTLTDNAQISNTRGNIDVRYAGTFSETNPNSVRTSWRRGVVNIEQLPPPPPPVVPPQPVVTETEIEVEDLFIAQNRINFDNFEQRGTLTILDAPRSNGPRSPVIIPDASNSQELSDIEPAAGDEGQGLGCVLSLTVNSSGGSDFTNRMKSTSSCI